MILDPSLKLVSYDVLRRMLAEHDVVEEFRAWYCTHVREITPTVAVTALKAVLVVYHFDDAVGPGMLRDTLGDVAKDVVARLSRWGAAPDVDGIRCAMDMFLSLWSNHHQTRSGDGMARVIQRRFWYSHARWNTLKRLGVFFTARRFSMEAFRDSPIRLCFQVASSEEVARKYGMWIHRMVFAANQRRTDGDDEVFEFDQDTMSFHVARTALLVHTHLAELVMMVGFVNAQLAQSAIALMPLLGAGLLGETTHSRAMLRALESFADVYYGWWDSNKDTILLRLQHLIYNRSYLLAMGSTIHAVTIEMVRLQYIIMAGVDEAEAFCTHSPQMRMLKNSQNHKFWNDSLTRDQTMHELLMDPDFLLKPAECYRELEDNYVRNPPRSVGDNEFLDMIANFQAAAIRCCRTPEEAWGVVGAFDLDKVRLDPSFLEHNDFESYIDTILVAHVFPLTRNPQRTVALRLQWDDLGLSGKGDATRAMLFAFGAVREMRVHEENVGITMMRAVNWVQRRELLRRRLPTVLTNTRSWFLHTLARVHGSEIVRIRSGDPYMMLSFLGKAFCDLVWDNRQLSESALPEILHMDLARLQDTRYLIHDVDDTAEARRVFTELMVSDRVPRTARFIPSSDFVLAAKKVRRVMLVCRTVHAQTASKVMLECVTEAI